MSEKRYEIVVDHDGGSRAEVAVCMRIANHGGDVVEALDSVARQDVSRLNLVLVDDHSTDDAPQTCARWLEAQASRFNKVAVLRHERPLGVAVSRNHGFTECGADFAFVLDATNRLFPRCLSRCREALSASGAALAYPAVEVFGARRGLSGTASDAHGPGGSRGVTGMALVDVSAWNAVGGYSEACEAGSEDAEFWSRLEGRGFHHVRVPEILGRYRARRAPWRNIGVVEAGNDRLKLGYIGQILPHKGLTVLLDAVSRLGPSVLGRMEVHIWGNVHSHGAWNDFNREFFAKVEQLQGLAYFHGEYGNDQLHLILDEIDALVVPSTWWENSPLTIQEAFLAGVPVLTSNVGGMKELVRDGVHGMLFEVNNSKDLAAKLESILERPSQLEAFRENRPDEVVQRMDEHVKVLSETYRGLLDGTPRSRPRVRVARAGGDGSDGQVTVPGTPPRPPRRARRAGAERPREGYTPPQSGIE